MDALGLITILESEVLEETVCGKRSGEEGRGEEAGGVGKNGGLSLGEEEWSESLGLWWHGGGGGFRWWCQRRRGCCGFSTFPKTLGEVFD